MDRSWNRNLPGLSHSERPARQLDVLCIWVVVSIAGLTGIESIFFSDAAAQQSGYEKGSAYQRQSGLFNIALALTTLLVYLAGWDLHAKACLLIVLLTFLFFSAINHAYSAIKEHNKSLNLSRLKARDSCFTASLQGQLHKL